MTFTRDTIRTIARNAGKVTKEQMSRDLSLSVALIERLAREQGIDLRLRIAPPDARDLPTFTPHDPRLRGRRETSDHVHTAQLNCRLTSSDFDVIEARAAELGIRRATVVTRLIENIIRRNLLADFTSLPAPMAATDAEDSHV